MIPQLAPFWGAAATGSVRLAQALIGALAAAGYLQPRGDGVIDIAVPTLLLLYLLGHVVNLVLTRMATGSVHALASGAPVNLVILPWSLLFFCLLTCAFIGFSGWHRHAHARRIVGLRLPWPTADTAVSGVGSAMMLSSIPLMFSLREVSVPVILLMMRGGALCMAPIVDLTLGRRIRWASATALVLVAAGLAVALLRPGTGFRLSALAWTAIALYNTGYLLRIVVMTRVAKRGDVVQTRQYYVEEKIIAMPLALLTLASLVAIGPGGHPEGFAGLFEIQWSAPLLLLVLAVGASLTFVSVLAAVLLLGAQENSYCVPLERAGGLLSGFIAAWFIHWIWNQPAPTFAELQGAVLLLAAMVLLLVVPRDDAPGLVRVRGAG